MRVYFQYPVQCCSGTRGLSTFSAYQNESVCIQREYVEQALTPQNTTLGDISKNLAEIRASFDAGWIADFETYAARYTTERGFGKYPVNYYGMYIHMWYKVNEDDPTIDLKTVTFADIGLLGFSIQTIKEAVEYGFLPVISEIDDLIAPYDGA